MTFACRKRVAWFYSSTSSYTTGGYGDVFLLWLWRTLGLVEILDTANLMGCSGC
jgi:hypothetical protein